MADETTCKVCVKKVLDSDDGMQCDSDCQGWYHIKCVGIPKSDYLQYSRDVNKKWHCQRTDCRPPTAAPYNLLMNKMDELLARFSNLATKDELKCISDGITDLRTDIGILNDRVSAFEPRLQAVEGEIAQLRTKIERGEAPVVENLIEEISDRQRRLRNLIAYNVKERAASSPNAVEQQDVSTVLLILKHAGLEHLLPSVRFFRIGKKTDGKSRPLKICLPSELDAMAVFRSFSKNEVVEGELRGVSLSHDRTLKERQHLAELRGVLQTRMDAGETNLTIRYTNGTPKIVKKN